ncbi:MAG: hypothetical protein IIB56_19090 [Planctomycetes bacterium]|nr:hypothetical protein [Planctomycetota bacterium]
MKSKYLHFVSFVLFLITFVIGGCVVGPQYFPKNLENRPKNELARLTFKNSRVIYLQIDGQKIRQQSTGAGFTLIYLAPGDHVLNYKFRGETQEWKNVVSSLEKKGFVPIGDGREFVGYEYYGDHLSKEEVLKCEIVRGTAAWYTSWKCVMSHRYEARPIGVSRYGWSTISKKVSIESGVTFWLSGEN